MAIRYFFDDYEFADSVKFLDSVKSPYSIDLF